MHLAFLPLVLTWSLFAAPPAEPPEGIAAKYVGDQGIENDPDVIFAEGFEQASVHETAKRWDNAKGLPVMRLADDVPPASGGERSLEIRHVGGQGTGGHLYRRLVKKDGTGYDRLYLRMYVKFDPDCAPIHHFGTHLGGFNPATRWPQGNAGIRPKGHDRFTVGVEPGGKRWLWDFYAYWMEMRGNPGGPQHWGNDLINDPDLRVAKGQWICVELMIKLNRPPARDGELALWIDGKPWMKDGQLVSHLGPGFPKGKWVWDSFTPDPKGRPFEGFRWRRVEALTINYVWLYLYITKAPAGHVSRVWFDDVVIATRYIGPLRPAD